MPFAYAVRGRARVSSRAKRWIQRLSTRSRTRSCLAITRVHGVDRRLDEDVQPQRLVHEALAVVHRLPRQADPQIAGVAFQNADRAGNVVQHLVAAPKTRLFTVEP